jgi:nicotinate-nucleotide adenylyltransferase
MRIALLGGSFNPPHIGHIILAEEILGTLDYDRVLFIPANIPPHKEPQGDPGTDMRLAMLHATLEGWSEFAIEPCELKRPGISYTIDTLREISRKYSFDGKPGLVIGDDLAPDFLKVWKDPELILEYADIIVAHREHAEELSLPYAHRYIKNLLIPVSSTLVRERIANHGAWRSLVSPGVQKIIETYGLYQNI